MYGVYGAFGPISSCSSNIRFARSLLQIEETAGTPCSVGGNSALLNSAIGNGRWIRISPEVLQQCSALSFFMDRFSHTNHGAREPEECWIRDNFAKFAAGSANGNQRMPPEAIWRSELQVRKASKGRRRDEEDEADARNPTPNNAFAVMHFWPRCAHFRPCLFTPPPPWFTHVWRAYGSRVPPPATVAVTHCCPPWFTHVWLTLASLVQLGTFEYVWKPYSCTIPLYTDEMIRTCFAEKGYARPVVKGDSISDFFRTYVEQRVKGARLTQFGSRAFEIQNFKLAHIVWHEDTVEAAVPVFKANGLEKGTGGARFWMLGPFFSSEREHHIMPGRYEYMASSMRETIEGAGYMEVDWREISKALAFDSATYLDGLHVVGPPMKTLFNIFIHAACSGDL